MARYKVMDTTPRLLPANLATRFPTGTFEHAVDHLLDQAIDLARFDFRFGNEKVGAPAYARQCCSRWCSPPKREG
jgi:hypothetical protein